MGLRIYYRTVAPDELRRFERGPEDYHPFFIGLIGDGNAAPGTQLCLEKSYRFLLLLLDAEGEYERTEWHDLAPRTAAGRAIVGAHALGLSYLSDHDLVPRYVRPEEVPAAADALATADLTGALADRGPDLTAAGWRVGPWLAEPLGRLLALYERARADGDGVVVQLW